MFLDQRKKVVVLGSGSWGTALAHVLSHRFDKVVILTRKADCAQEINTLRTNKTFLPALTLAKNVSASTDYAEIQDADLLFVVVPTSAMRDTAKKLANSQIPNRIPIVSCSKGIERGTGARMSNIIHEQLPHNPIAYLSGPNHAEEVAEDLVTCTVIGCVDPAVATELQNGLTTPTFRPYTSSDIAGMELGGALKNVFAIAAGIATGLKLGDNALAALVTRGLAEMTRLGVALGGQRETFFGLSGLGDLMTTCYSAHSRNNRVGVALGQGMSLEEAIDSIGMVAEGIPNSLSIYEAARKAGVETPIIDTVYNILYNHQPAANALRDLLDRETKPETHSHRSH